MVGLSGRSLKFASPGMMGLSGELFGGGAFAVSGFTALPFAGGPDSRWQAEPKIATNAIAASSE